MTNELKGILRGFPLHPLFFLLFLSFHSCSVFNPPTAESGWREVPPFQFSSNSVWRQPIPSNAAIDPASPRLVAAIKAGRPPYSPWGLAQIPVFRTQDRNPRYSIPVVGFPAPWSGIREVPFPDGALPYRESDSPITLIDPTGTHSYEFWNLKLQSGRWVAGNGGVFDLTGDGIAPYMVTRASGFSQLAGLIWPSEILDGAIDHPLVISWVKTRKGVSRFPAVATDGWSTDEDALPMGALIQLDPALDLSTLTNLDAGQRAVFKALQNYGAYVADTGGFSVFLVSPNSFASDPYVSIPSYKPEGATMDLSPLPLERLRVLTLGSNTSPQPRTNWDPRWYY